MCLTIPKRVVEIKENTVVVELPNKTRQEVKSIVDLSIGDFCLTQQNVAIQKIDVQEAEKIISDIKEAEI